MAKSKKNKEVADIPKGKPKSGRVWKTDKTRFNSMKMDKPFKTTWATKQKLRNELKTIKEADRAIKEAKKQAIEGKKQRRAENLRRREENAKKAEIVQKVNYISVYSCRIDYMIC
ncbi:hypothetical protein CHUAL_005758 [Chamberlinius hualienensis]